MDSAPSARQAQRLEILEVVCAVLIVLLLIALAFELFGRYPADSALVVSLATLVLVSVFCLLFGADLRGRLKKLGPLELYEDKAQTIVESFKRYRLEFRVGEGTGQPWKGLRRLQYEELVQLVVLTELEGQVPEKGYLRKSFFQMLFQVGTAAAAQGEWTQAAKRLERLVELSHGQYEPGSTFFNLGLALLGWAESHEEEPETLEGDNSRDELLRKAVFNLETACSHDPHDHKAPYWLAYALDELGQYGAAIKVNAAAIGNRPQFAPAKYNSAVSSVKLKRYRSAFRRLQTISLDDDLGKETFRQAKKDAELRPLLEHPEIGTDVIEFLRRMTEDHPPPDRRHERHCPGVRLENQRGSRRR